MTKARNLSDLLDATGDVVSTALDNVPPSDNASSLTTGTLPIARLADGSITNAKLNNDAKVVKSASAPSNPNEGDLWYDTGNEILKIYQSSTSNFIKVSAEPAILTSVSGTLFTGQTSNLTLSGSGFLSSNLVVNFLQVSDAIDVDVTVTPTSVTSATVTVPSSVYNNVTSGNVVTIKVTNSDTKSSGNQTITAQTPPYDIDFLVIAGGGGGGTSNGSHITGGGGAGGYRASFNNETSGGGGSSENSLSVDVGTVFTITVGAGGAAQTNGVNSSISGTGITTITSIGGGNANNGGVNPGDGGSGGGETDGGQVSGGSGTANQGFDGGESAGAAAGGGGGAGSAGANASLLVAGNGGNGVASTITGSSVTRAGGGGGGVRSDGTVGSGGSGGGGNGEKGNSVTAQAGTVNTGSGGGGNGQLVNFGYGGTGGAGGSGVVILRFPTVKYSGTTTGSPTVSTSGSDTILTFNSSGSYTA
jgi:hypothetical protein